MAEKTVIDRVDWLRRQAESLVADGDPRAIGYLHQLLELTSEPKDHFYCFAKIGLLHFRLGDVAEAREAFEQAAAVDSCDPGVAYALGQCDRASGDPWEALAHFAEATYRGRERSHPDLPEYMRSAAVVLIELGLDDDAATLLLGALDRAPDNPLVLESLGRLYEEKEQWRDAIDVRDALIELLKGDNQREPAATAARFFELDSFDANRVRSKIRAINERMRRDIQLVGEASDLSWAFPGERGLSRINLPPGLYTMVEELAARERNIPLLESAQVLWARAWHDRFDVYLKPQLLAAAIHWIVERQHWRIPTSNERLAEMYGFAADRIAAAVRLVASRFDVRLFPAASRHGAKPETAKRLDDFASAILYDIEPGRMASGVPMLEH